MKRRIHSPWLPVLFAAVLWIARAAGAVTFDRDGIGGDEDVVT